MRRLGLVDVRNYAELELELPDGLVVFAGRNAQGKSNLLEAIGLLATGKSFRTSHEGELVRRGAARAVVAGRADVAAGNVTLACEIVTSEAGTRKAYRVNSEATKFARYLGNVRAVTFTPSDLDLVDGPPSGRRALLNGALAQSDPRYYRELARYTKVLAQKRALLRAHAAPDRDLLRAYNDQLAAAGGAIVEARAAYLTAFAGAAAGAQRALALDGDLEVRYAPNVETGALAARLAEREQLEIARRMPLVGPHRDDLELRLDGIALAAFGSQGQKRTAVLALKLAEYAVSRAEAGEAPLLLLDDVLSELDEVRQRRFLESIAPFDQVFLTATALPEAVTPPAIYRVEGGHVQPC